MFRSSLELVCVLWPASQSLEVKRKRGSMLADSISEVAAMRTIRTRLRILFDEADTETKMSKEHRGINRGRERDRDRDSAAQKPWGQSSSRYPASEMSQQRISSSWNSRTLPTAADSPLLSSDEVEQPSRGESPKTRYYPVEPIAKLLPEIRRAASVSHSRGRSPIRSVKSRYRDRRDSRDEARLKERVYKREAEKEFGTDCESGGSYPSN